MTFTVLPPPEIKTLTASIADDETLAGEFWQYAFDERKGETPGDFVKRMLGDERKVNDGETLEYDVDQLDTTGADYETIAHGDLLEYYTD